MIKIIPPGAWAFDGPQLEEIKCASTGLRGRDFAAFVKRASHPLANWVRANPPAPGEVYVHAIGMGSTEKVGGNRNGDGYSDAMLRLDTPTFEKYARWYVNHRNTDPAASYGRVKKATYDPDVGRVETISALYATKQAAQAGGGLVAAKTLDKLASGRDVAVSQSCRVKEDVCTSCGNRARNRSEYCGPAHCKYGGCRDNLGRVFDDGFHLIVDNPRCTFFDLSDVSDTRGADRTAFVTGKVAAARFAGGAELAEALGLVTPDYLIDADSLAAMGCLRKLAGVGRLTPAPTWDDCVAVRAGLARKSAAAAVPADDYARQEFVADLASAGVVLPPARWLAYMTGVAADKCAAAFDRELDADRDLLARADACDLLAAVPVKAAGTAAAKWGWLAPSVKAHAAESARGVLAGGGRVKAAAATPPALAAEVRARYLAYQGRALAAHAHEPGYPVLLAECARHNLCQTV